MGMPSRSEIGSLSLIIEVKEEMVQSRVNRQVEGVYIQWSKVAYRV